MAEAGKRRGPGAGSDGERFRQVPADGRRQCWRQRHQRVDHRIDLGRGVLVAGVGAQRTANDKARGRADCFQHAPRQESVVSNGGGTAYRADDVEGDASQQYGLATIAIRQWPVGQLGNCQCQQVERDGLRHLPVGDAKFRGHARHGGQIDVRRDQAEGAQHGGGQNER
ncbi:hypothetical protein G6F35_013840 [Rhizopus arrhizus]|nr:hypothetical protein G6F35_013840 [Rhizopus arrhizus]